MKESPPPLLSIERVQFIKKTKSKKCAFDSLTKLLANNISHLSKDEIFDALIAREKLGNTSIGNGIAIPRAYLDIPFPIAALLVLKKGIDLNAADKNNVKYFLAILLPTDDREKYAEIIKAINKKLVTKKKYTIKSLDKKTDPDNPEILMHLFESLFTHNMTNLEGK